MSEEVEWLIFSLTTLEKAKEYNQFGTVLLFSIKLIKYLTYGPKSHY